MSHANATARRNDAAEPARHGRSTMPDGAGPEYAVLLDAIAPLRFGSVPAPQMDEESWQRTLEAAQWHRLTPLLHRHLAGAGGAPAAPLEASGAAYAANAARNLFVGAALGEALEALDGAGVGAMLLKGAALVDGVYPDPAIREMLDVDLLVGPADLERAGAALRALGYRTEIDPAAAGGGSAPQRHHHDPALVDPRSLVAFELHHHIATADEAPRFDVGGIWERARPARRSPGHLTPAPEDLLLHIALHFTRNRLGGSSGRGSAAGALAQIGDMAWVVASEPLDWDAVARTSRTWGVATRVFLALFAADQLGVPVPREVLRSIEPEGFDPRAGHRLVTLRVLRTGPQFPVRRLRWMLAPPREALTRGWDADSKAARSLARAYARRAAAHLPLAGTA